MFSDHNEIKLGINNEKKMKKTTKHLEIKNLLLNNPCQITSLKENLFKLTELK